MSIRPPPRIKLIWGGAKAIRGRWYAGLFGFYDRVEGVPDSGLAISMRGVLGWSAALAAAGYVALASVVYHAFWAKNPYNRLTYADALLYPLRRAEIAEKKGQAFLAQGQALFHEKKYHDAANLLRLGLARAPGDLAARRTLAQYYLLANQRPMAVRVLQEGMANGYPGREYLQTLFAAAEQAEDFALVFEATDRLSATAPAEDRRWLQERRFAALAGLGRHAEALALAEQAGDGETTREQRVLALLALGRTGDALAALANWKRQPEANRATVARLTVRTCREAGRFEEMETALAELRALAPADPAPLVFGVVQWAMAGRAEAARAALDDYVFRFGGSAANLLLVAEPLGQIGDAALLERCRAAGKERGFPLQRIQSLLVEALVQRGTWAAARQELEDMPKATGREAALAELWREWMRRLIEAAEKPTEASRLALQEFLRQRPWPMQIFKRTVETLRAAGGQEAVRETLALASRTFPASPWVQEETKRLDELVAARAGKEGGRGTAAESSRDADVELDERTFWGRLENAVAEKRWAEAERRIQLAFSARPAPSWLSESEAALRLMQVRVGHGLGDMTTVLAATKLYLNGDGRRSQQIVEAAQEFVRGGDKAMAAALVREVLRRAPDFTPAKKLAAELNPEGSAEKKKT